MAEIHNLIERRGIQDVRRSVASKHDRAMVDTAASFMMSEEDGPAYSHAGFAMTSLPHKNTAETIWRRDGHTTTLIIQSGVDRRGQHVGLPYGSLARLILLYLQSEAIKANSPTVELGPSMKQWLKLMGLNIGGKTYRLVSDQAYRISTCTLAFITESKGHEARQNATFVERAITMLDVLGDQPSLWQEQVTLNRHFYESLRAHPVPVSEAAIRAIGSRSLVLDIYVWLCYRLQSLRKDQPVSWISLHQQFGTGFQAVRQFKSHFIQSLDLALAVYPHAQIAVTETGVTLSPSHPAIAKLSTGGGRR